MEQAWSPGLAVLEVHGRCRLSLGGHAYGDGDTLQPPVSTARSKCAHLGVNTGVRTWK